MSIKSPLPSSLESVLTDMRRAIEALSLPIWVPVRKMLLRRDPSATPSHEHSLTNSDLASAVLLPPLRAVEFEEHDPAVKIAAQGYEDAHVLALVLFRRVIYSHRMTYRPITDTWFLARAKLKGGVKYYGAYLGGFPERARALLGVTVDDPVLHVCGGQARLYLYQGGFGPNDKTLDLDPAVSPDFLQDAREPYPYGFKAILADPPYSEADAEHYAPGSDAYPSPNTLLKRAFDALPVGARVGLIHYILPQAPKPNKFVAAIGVMCGFNNRIRVFSVFEKL